MTSEALVMPVSKKALWGGRIISALPVLMLTFSGVMKLTQHADVVKGFSELGYDPSLAVPLGIVELTCTLLYVIPRTSVLGAILLTGYLGGAIYTHVRAGSPLLTHTLFGVYLGVLIWGGLWLRDDRVRALIPFAR